MAMNGITPVAALFEELHSNHDAIHKCVQNLNQIKAHDDQMQKLEDQRATFQEEARLKNEAEDREVAERRAKEDEERRTQREVTAKTFHEDLDSEMGKLEDEIADRLNGGDVDLQALLEKRKEINERIDSEMQMPLQFPTSPIRKRGELRGKSIVGEHRATPPANGPINDDISQASENKMPMELLQAADEKEGEAFAVISGEKSAVAANDEFPPREEKLFAEEAAPEHHSGSPVAIGEKAAIAEPVEIAKNIEDTENTVLIPEAETETVAALPTVKEDNSEPISEKEVPSSDNLEILQVAPVVEEIHNPEIVEETQKDQFLEDSVQLPGHIKQRLFNTISENGASDGTDIDHAKPSSEITPLDPFSDDFAADYQSTVSIVPRPYLDIPEAAEQVSDKIEDRVLEPTYEDDQTNTIQPSIEDVITSTSEASEVKDNISSDPEAFVELEAPPAAESIANIAESGLDTRSIVKETEKEEIVPGSETVLASLEEEKPHTEEEKPHIEEDVAADVPSTEEISSTPATSPESSPPAIFSESDNHHRRVESQTSLLSLSAAKTSRPSSISSIENGDRPTTSSSESERTLTSKGSRRSLLGGFSAIASFASAIRGTTASPANETLKEVKENGQTHVPGAFEQTPSVTDVEDPVNDAVRKLEDDEEFDEAAFQPRDLDAELKQHSLLAVATTKPEVIDVMQYLVTEDDTPNPSNPSSQNETEEEDENDNDEEEEEENDQDEEEDAEDEDDDVDEEPVKTFSTREYVESLARANITVPSQSTEQLTAEEASKDTSQAVNLPRNDSTSSLHTQHHIRNPTFPTEHEQHEQHEQHYLDEQNLHETTDSEDEPDEKDTVTQDPTTPVHSRNPSLDFAAPNTSDHGSQPSTPDHIAQTPSTIHVSHTLEPAILSSSPTISRLHNDNYSPDSFNDIHVSSTEGAKPFPLSPGHTELEFVQGQPLPSPRFEMKDQTFGGDLVSKASISQLDKAAADGTVDVDESPREPMESAPKNITTSNTFQQRRSVFETPSRSASNTPPPPSSLAMPLSSANKLAAKTRPVSASFGRPVRRGSKAGNASGRRVSFEDDRNNLAI